MQEGEFKRTTHLSDAMRQEVLDRLDQNANEARLADSNGRRDPRWPYRQNDIAITVEHPGGGVSRLLLFARNISAGGISFVHNGFLYPGSRCKVLLPQQDGRICHLIAAVVRCRHVHGLFHEIGVRFESRIDPEQFLANTDELAGRQSDTMELPEMLGRIGILESSKADAALMQHYLKLGGVAATVLGSTGAALDHIKQNAVDIIICELNVTGYDGVEFIAKLRESAFAGPVAVVTAETDQTRLKAAQRAGADHVLTKPYETAALLSVLVKMNEKIGTVLPRNALFSTVDEKAGLSELIVAYIEQVRQTARVIEHAMSSKDIAPLRQLCISLKGSAAGYGFNVLGDLAASTVEMLDANSTLPAMTPRLRTLCSLCKRLRLRPSKARRAA